MDKWENKDWVAFVKMVNDYVISAQLMDLSSGENASHTEQLIKQLGYHLTEQHKIKFITC